MSEDYSPLILQNKVYYCVECGKCSSICPMNRGEDAISPRRIVKKILERHENEVIEDKWLYSCLICGLCDEVCPSAISFTSLIREIRRRALESGNRKLCSQAGSLLQLGGMMTLPSLNQNRLSWVPEEARISDKGEVLYFVGCLPYFDAIFKDLGIKTLDMAKGTVKMLNAAGIEPVLSNSERCCGHDQLWSGDVATFELLAKLNMEHFKELGIKKLLVSCPECYETISKYYPKFAGDLDFEVIYSLDFISELIEDGKIKMKTEGLKATYHDPCSLGRHLNKYDSPRNVLKNIDNMNFIEMEQIKEAGPCCGVSAWITCDSKSQKMQMDRLNEAKRNGADKLVTSCPKCYIHFTCALKKRPQEEKDKMDMEVLDLTTLASNSMAKTESEGGMTMEGNVLVVGGGVAGIQASLDLANKGIQVYLVEKEPSIGGIMALLDKTFPTNDCSICILAPKMSECFSHPNIDVMTYSELVSLTGDAPNLKATVLKKARFVDEKKCTGCGECTQKCPVKIPNKYNMNLDKRKAIYLPFPQSVPRIMTIDKENCIKFTKDKCGNCEKACKAQAIDYDQQDEEISLDVGAVVVASGFEVYNPEAMFEYGYGKYVNVRTAIEYERLICASGPTGGHLKVEPEGEHPKQIAFIQCVGSRDFRRENPYCSSVCCMYATKEAMLAREHYDDIEPYIFYIDLRAVGKDFQQYVDRAKRDYGIKFIRARPGRIDEDQETKKLTIWYDDLINPKVQSKKVDMVILCTALRPSSTSLQLGWILGIETDEYGFFKARDPLGDPVNSTKEGIFIAGYCAGPKDIPESVTQASGASARASEIIAQAGGGET